MATLYTYVGGYGDLVEVEEVMIPGVGLGVTFHTTHSGASLPLEEIPRLIQALNKGLHIVPSKERQA